MFRIEKYDIYSEFTLFGFLTSREYNREIVLENNSLQECRQFLEDLKSHTSLILKESYDDMIVFYGTEDDMEEIIYEIIEK